MVLGALFAGLGVLSGVPLTLTSGTILVMLLPDTSDAEVFGRSDDDMDCLGESSTWPKVASDRGKEGAELRTGDRLPAFATAMAPSEM